MSTDTEFLDKLAAYADLHPADVARVLEIRDRLEMLEEESEQWQAIAQKTARLALALTTEPK